MRLVTKLAHQFYHGRSEDGFTLVELLVACILLVIVLVVMFAVLLDAFRSSERSRQRSKAQRNVTLVSEKLESDISAMRAPNRNPRDQSDIEMMRENYTVSDQFLEIHDIVLAQTDRLIFFAELNGGQETGTATDYNCVEWVVEPDQSVRRRVYPYSKHCVDAIAQKNATLDEEVMPAPDTGEATDKNFRQIFSYFVTDVPAGGDPGTCDETQVQQVNSFGGLVTPTAPQAADQDPNLDSNTGSGSNIDAAAGANADGNTPDQNSPTQNSPTQNSPTQTSPVQTSPGGFHQAVVPGYGPQELDHIVAIQLNLRSLVSVKGSRGEDHFTQKLTIPSRQQYEFRYAIGCAE